MKNRSILFFVSIILFTVVLGCSSINPFSAKNKKSSPTSSANSSTDKGADTTTDETTGIPECDQALDMISDEANNPDDNYVVKAGKAVVLNRIKESIRKGIEENKNKNGTEELTKTCSDFKKQIEKYKAQEEEKKGN